MCGGVLEWGKQKTCLHAQTREEEGRMLCGVLCVGVEGEAEEKNNRDMTMPLLVPHDFETNPLTCFYQTRTHYLTGKGTGGP